ncbi:MAG: TIGR03620 family F420-dependent LLM class oxidoreductase [Sporichthyaceae bacterium]
MSTQPLASSEDEVNPFRGQRAHFAAALDRARLGRVGLWTFDFDVQPWAAVRPTLELLEKEGVGTVWFPELFGRDALTQAGLILGATERMVAANGILRTDRYSATAAAAGAMTLADAYPGRHVLGLGVGPFPDGDPFALLGAFLDGLAQASTSFPPPNTPPPIVVAAYGPRMCQFGADRTAGLHTYLVTVEHTARVREQVGAEPFLAVEQAVVIGEGAAARDAARAHVGFYLSTPYNVNKFKRLGFTDDDLAGGGSDRLVDALVAYGPPAVVANRIREQLAAGADHVGVQFLGTDGAGGLCAAWADLAGALGEV